MGPLQQLQCDIEMCIGAAQERGLTREQILLEFTTIYRNLLLVREQLNLRSSIHRKQG